MKMNMIVGICLVLVITTLTGCRSNGAGIAESALVLEHSSGASGQVAWGDTTVSGTSEPAQSFTLSENATVARVRIRTLNIVGNPTAYYRVGIHADDSGQPAASELSSKTKDDTEIAVDAWDDWVLDTPVDLSSGQTYWIVCTTSESTGGDDYFELFYTPSGDAYAGGEFAHKKAGVWDSMIPTGQDLWFQLYE